MSGETVTIHADSTKTKAGSRFWIHARSVSDALLFLSVYGEVGEMYNIVGEKEIDNLQIAKGVAAVLGKELKYEMTDFHSSRPGHDLRYALDGTKLADLGWRPQVNFEASMKKTIGWMVDEKNKRWLNL